MDNLTLLRQTIRFQRTALQNSLAMIAALQQHGEKFLKTTLGQSPWIPGEGKDVWLFWAGLWAKNLAGMTDVVDMNLATMERLSSTGKKRGAGEARPPEKPVVEPKNEPPPGAARKEAPERKQEAAPEIKPGAEKSGTDDKEPPPQELLPQKKTETALAKIEVDKAQVSEPPDKKPEQPHGRQPKKKTEHKS